MSTSFPTSAQRPPIHESTHIHAGRPNNGSTIGRLCRRLDGIPFAIELAAARLRSLSVRDLDAHLNKRFRLLTGGSRTALPRQQTLKALIDWSYDLLPAAEQTVLARLSVFAGGFDMAAAEAVCPGGEVDELDVLDLVDALVDKSLVQADDCAIGVRYRLLETIRDYAGDRLAERGECERTAVSRAHRDHFLALAETAQSQLRGQYSARWAGRLDVERDNLRAAHRESLSDPDPGPGLRLADALSEFWSVRGYGVEGAATLRAHLERPSAQAPTLLRGRALAAAGYLAEQYGADLPAATALADQALSIAYALGDEALGLKAQFVLTWARHRQGDHSGCLVLIDRALPVARRLRDLHAEAILLNVRGAALSGLEKDARASFEEAAALFRRVGDQRGAAAALGNAGFDTLCAGDVAAARDFIGEAIHIYRDLGDRGRAVAAIYSGYVAYLDGDDTAACQLFSESLDIARRIGHRRYIAESILGLALTATLNGAAGRGATLHGFANGLFQRLGEALNPFKARLRDADLNRLRSLVGVDRFDIIYRNGRAMSLDEALRVATG